MRVARLLAARAWLTGPVTVLALAAVAAPAPAAPPHPAPFAPPLSPLLLTRTLHRALPDGKAVVTRRSYEVRIARNGDGFVVEGKLVDCQVEAPPSLAAMAEIERRRPDDGLFPIMLDHRGMILGGAGLQSDGSRDRAAALTSRRIGNSSLPVADIVQAQAFVEQLRSGTAQSHWPVDIFHPRPGTRSESREAPLPGGEDGRLTIEIAGRPGFGHGELSALERVVTTDIGGDRRVVREDFRLRKLASLTER